MIKKPAIVIIALYLCVILGILGYRRMSRAQEPPRYSRHRDILPLEPYVSNNVLYVPFPGYLTNTNTSPTLPPEHWYSHDQTFSKPLTVRWDLEPWRQWNEKAAKEMKPEDMGIVNPITIGHTLLVGPLANQMIGSTNNVELGFRSDGIVVWRVPPEAKP